MLLQAHRCTENHRRFWFQNVRIVRISRNPRQMQDRRFHSQTRNKYTIFQETPVRCQQKREQNNKKQDNCKKLPKSGLTHRFKQIEFANEKMIDLFGTGPHVLDTIPLLFAKSSVFTGDAFTLLHETIEMSHVKTLLFAKSTGTVCTT